MTEKHKILSNVEKIPTPVKNAPLSQPFHWIDTGPLGTDLLKTAGQIAMFMTGSDSVSSRRKVFHMLESSSFLPAIKATGTWWLRKSSVRATLWMHERRAWDTEQDVNLVRLNLLLNMLVQRLPANDNLPRDVETDNLTGIIIELSKTVRQLLNLDAA